MSQAFAVKAISPSTTGSTPHVLGFSTPRGSAGDTLLEIWNASTNAGKKWHADKDGNTYQTGILQLNTTVTTGASAGDAVLGYGPAVRSVNNAGNGTLPLISAGTIGATADVVRINHTGASIVAVGTPGGVGGAAVGDLVIANAKALRAPVAAGTSTVALVSLDANDILRLGVTRAAASNAASFSATHYARLRDSAGNELFVPAMNAAW